MRTSLLACLSAALLVAPAATHAQAISSAEQLNQNVAVEIRSDVQGQLEGFYARRNYWPIWVENGALSPAALSALELLETADADGLDPASYDTAALRQLITEAQGGEPKALARAELGLSREFAAYVRDTRKPRLEMPYFDVRVEPRVPEVEEVLGHVAAAESLSDYVSGMKWMNPYYLGLRDAIARHQGRWGELPRVSVPAGPLLKVGESGPRVSLLRQRLGLEPGNLFDEQVAEAVGLFQRDHGLDVDRAVGPNTLKMLNSGGGDLAHLRLNLERARLLPDASTRYVLVNAAAARLHYFKDGKEEGSMKVVVGTTATPTPLMAGVIHYATLNPYWNVPVNLVRQNIAPKVLAGNSLTAMGYEALADWTVDAEVIDPKTIDWKAVARGDIEVRVRQLPSQWNSMGKMKFLFPNDLGIYLHDTPNRELFKAKSRQFSNGCVRLEDATRLGEWLFDKPLTSPSSDPEQYVQLPESVPIYLTYLTAVPEGTGIAFLDDVYGYDRKRAEQFALSGEPASEQTH